jgi:predicted MFS family arabinose efflux permease
MTNVPMATWLQGERNVGYVMCSMYAASAVVSVCVGRVSDVVGRPAVLGFAALCIAAMLWVLKYQAPTSAAAIYALAVTIGTGMQTLRTPLAAQMSANYRDDIEAALAATEMVCSVVGAVGYLLATAISEDDKLNLAALLSAIGFGCYFVEDRMRRLDGEATAPAAGALGGKVVMAAGRSPPVAVGARLLDSLLFNGSERRQAKNGHSLR